jgi:hypothetical protein
MAHQGVIDAADMAAAAICPQVHFADPPPPWGPPLVPGVGNPPQVPMSRVPRWANPTIPPGDISKQIIALHGGNNLWIDAGVMGELQAMEALLSSQGPEINAYALGQTEGPIAFLTVPTIAPGDYPKIEVVHMIWQYIRPARHGIATITDPPNNRMFVAFGETPDGNQS